MLQSSGSFFSYEPILRALQCASLPLPHILAYPADMKGAERWCRFTLPKFTLWCRSSGEATFLCQYAACTGSCCPAQVTKP